MRLRLQTAAMMTTTDPMPGFGHAELPGLGTLMIGDEKHAISAGLQPASTESNHLSEASSKRRTDRP